MTVNIEFLRFLRGLRARRFDLVIDLQGLFRSGFLAWASGAGVRIGMTLAHAIGPFKSGRGLEENRWPLPTLTPTPSIAL